MEKTVLDILSEEDVKKLGHFEEKLKSASSMIELKYYKNKIGRLIVNAISREKEKITQ